jgi:hypothetical protein
VNVALHGLPQWEKRVCRGFVMPSLQECRAFYDGLTGTSQRWQAPLVEASLDPKLMEMIDDLEKDEDDL